jgi:hypothetical protein
MAGVERSIDKLENTESPGTMGVFLPFVCDSEKSLFVLEREEPGFSLGARRCFGFTNRVALASPFRQVPGVCVSTLAARYSPGDLVRRQVLERSFRR